MSRRLSLTLLVAALALAIAVPVYADGPTFGPAIYGDGEAWGTKGLGNLPAPNDHMKGSFDRLFVFPDPEGGEYDLQMPVSEAAPGNPAYNGGRWWAVEATWVGPHDPVVLTSYSSEYVDDPFDSFEYHYNLGHIEVTPTTMYFQCPLLPVK
jgi:hypothetical protein